MQNVTLYERCQQNGSLTFTLPEIDDTFHIYFKEMGFETSCKLSSPDETICSKC